VLDTGRDWCPPSLLVAPARWSLTADSIPSVPRATPLHQSPSECLWRERRDGGAQATGRCTAGGLMSSRRSRASGANDVAAGDPS
jgi:hypothetical protein